jgi:transposase
MNSDGSIVEESMYNNTSNEAGIFAYSMVKKYGKCIAVCESTANLWLKTYQAFEKYNIDVKLANPLKTKAIAEARIKTDKLDARTLAHLLRSDLVAECYIANKKTREERSLLRLRTNLVQDRTRVINRTHSLLDKYDMNFGYSKIFGIKGLQWLRDLRVSGNDQILLQEYISQIDFLTTQIKNIESKIRVEASNNESVKILMSMTGIDYFSAMMIASEIGDITRFSTPEKLVSWVGLCPSVHQSGRSLHMGRMKEGNKKIRWILIEAAHTASRTDDRLRKFYLRLVKRHGHHIAITHVANKMCIIIWHMLTHKKLYNDRKQHLLDTKLKRIQRQ